MAQEAYDFARFEPTQRASAPEKTKQQEQVARLRSVMGGKQRQGALQKMFARPLYVAFAVVFFVSAFMLLKSEATLTEYSQQIQAQNAALVVAKSEYSYLENALNASINLDQVERVAKDCGLVKLDESQVTYFRLEEQAVMQLAQTTSVRVVEQVKQFFLQLLAYFNP